MDLFCIIHLIKKEEGWGCVHFPENIFLEIHIFLWKTIIYSTVQNNNIQYCAKLYTVLGTFLNTDFVMDDYHVCIIESVQNHLIFPKITFPTKFMLQKNACMSAKKATYSITLQTCFQLKIKKCNEDCWILHANKKKQERHSFQKNCARFFRMLSVTVKNTSKFPYKAVQILPETTYLKRVVISNIDFVQFITVYCSLQKISLNLKMFYFIIFKAFLFYSCIFTCYILYLYAVFYFA